MVPQDSFLFCFDARNLNLPCVGCIRLCVLFFEGSEKSCSEGSEKGAEPRGWTAVGVVGGTRSVQQLAVYRRKAAVASADVFNWFSW